jgi:hypothetical protein
MLARLRFVVDSNCQRAASGARDPRAGGRRALISTGRKYVHKYIIAESPTHRKRLLYHLAENCTTGPNSFPRALGFHGKGRPPVLWRPATANGGPAAPEAAHDCRPPSAPTVCLPRSPSFQLWHLRPTPGSSNKFTILPGPPIRCGTSLVDPRLRGGSSAKPGGAADVLPRSMVHHSVLPWGKCQDFATGAWRYLRPPLPRGRHFGHHVPGSSRYGKPRSATIVQSVNLPAFLTLPTCCLPSGRFPAWCSANFPRLTDLRGPFHPVRSGPSLGTGRTMYTPCAASIPRCRAWPKIASTSKPFSPVGFLSPFGSGPGSRYAACGETE